MTLKKKHYEAGFIKSIDEQRGTVDFDFYPKTVDRDGEVVEPMGIETDEFERNPVFLWAHDQRSMPLGRVIPTTMRKTAENFSGRVEFDMDDPDAVKAFRKYQKGILNAVSIGFIPLAAGSPVIDGQRGDTFTRSKLLEISAVPVPSNPLALQRGFADDDPELKARIKSFLMDDNVEKTALGWIDFLNKEANADVQPANMKGLPPIIQAISGSYEWIRAQLTRQAKEYLQSSSVASAVNMHDSVRVIATFETEAIVCVIGMDRPYSEDECYRVGWSTNLDGPEFSGDPTLVALEAHAADVQRSVSESVKKEMQARADEITHVDFKASPTLNSNNGPLDHARDRLKAWASIDNDTFDFGNAEHRKRYAEAFAIVKGSGLSEEDYLFRHHDIVNGMLVTDWTGTALSMIDFIKSSDFSEEDRQTIHSHLKAHYEQFGKQAPELVQVTADDSPAEGTVTGDSSSERTPEPEAELDLTDDEIATVADLVAENLL